MVIQNQMMNLHKLDLDGGGHQMPMASQDNGGTTFPPKSIIPRERCSQILYRILFIPAIIPMDSTDCGITGRVWKRNLKWKKAEKFLKKAQQYNFQKFPASQFVDEPEIEVRTSEFQCFY